MHWEREEAGAHIRFDGFADKDRLLQIFQDLVERIEIEHELALLYQQVQINFNFMDAKGVKLALTNERMELVEFAVEETGQLKQKFRITPLSVIEERKKTRADVLQKYHLEEHQREIEYRLKAGKKQLKIEAFKASILAEYGLECVGGKVASVGLIVDKRTIKRVLPHIADEHEEVFRASIRDEATGVITSHRYYSGDHHFLMEVRKKPSSTSW